MRSLKADLESSVAGALARVGIHPPTPVITQATKPEFGDYQANGAMAAAKAAKRPPREIAVATVTALADDPLLARSEVAGPGFINLHLRDDAILSRLTSDLVSPWHLSDPQRIVVDYSAPNLAKEMHVGHLRSTIIGDALARVFEHLGHAVIRQNHIGDWGTQFGMLITRLTELGRNHTGDNEALADLEQFYVESKQRFDADADFANRSRLAVVALQSGDERARQAWQRFLSLSFAHCQTVYSRLNVRLSPSDVRGESAYNDMLPGIVSELERQGLLTVDAGAKCVFMDEFKGNDDRPLPIIVQKSDGGYLYATTDLAAVRYRTHELHADRIVYVVGNPQALHFRQLFALSRRAGFATEGVELDHCGIGQVLGADGKKLSTRDGKAIKLTDLLDEAERRAQKLVDDKSTHLDAAERTQIATAVGIGAIKYADLSKHRGSDYMFDWDQMISLDGNTAPYLQYAQARIRSVFRRAGLDRSPEAAIVLGTTQERTLALHLIRLPETLEAVARELLPHYLCTYLYELAGYFSRFYEHCPILDAEPALKDSRLTLAWRTGEVLRMGLDLLGIQAPERL